MLRKLFPRGARSSLVDLAGGVWAIDERLEPLLVAITKKVINADDASLQAAEEQAGERVHVENGVAHVPIDGLLVSRGAEIFRYFGIAATGYDEINAAVGRAKKSDVEEVVLHVNSPGGSVTGLQATASRLFALRSRKPVHAHVSGIMASAAYWLGSQAGHVTAEEGAEIGSIGVYATVEDSSKMFEDAGIKVHVLRSGEYKGVGEPGAPISSKQLKKIQASVDRAAAEFVAAIARGRDMKRSDVEALATGETWDASDARDAGLIDAVDLVDLEETNNEAPDGAEPQEDRMSEKTAADLAALKAQIEQLRADMETQVQTRVDNEKAKFEAELAAKNAVIEGINESQKTAMIEAAAADGRIVPASRKAIDEYAKTATVEQLEGFLASLPKTTNPDPLGGDTNTSSEPPVVFDSKVIKARRALGVPSDGEHFFANVKHALGDGQFVMKDGSVQSQPLPKKEVN